MFTDYGTYWVSNAPQRTTGWFEVRKSRPTASNFYSCVKDHRFSTIQETLLHVAGIKYKEHDEKSQKRMDYGTEKEPVARKWYEKKYNVKVIEIGLAIPKFDPRIGGSPDGLVEGTDGIIEIKCVDEMYKPLLEIIKKGIKPKNHNHIWDSHYYQMQGCMAILNKKWCDYIVFCLKQNKVYVERIYFDRFFWDNVLYPKLCIFIDELNKIKKNDKYPIIPSE